MTKTVRRNKHERVFPEQEDRVETGVIRFGSDWPGFFFRGDDALRFAASLRNYVESQRDSDSGDIIDVISYNYVKGMIEELMSVGDFGVEPDDEE